MSPGRAENQMNQLNVYQGRKQNGCWWRKICCQSHTHTKHNYLRTHSGTLRNLDTKIQRETHTHSHLNRDEPISRRQTSVWQRDGGSEKEWEMRENTLKHSVCRRRQWRRPERRNATETPSHSDTLTLKWPEANPSWHSGWIMWQNVWGERDRRSDTRRYYSQRDTEEERQNINPDFPQINSAKYRWMTIERKNHLHLWEMFKKTRFQDCFSARNPESFCNFL